MDAELPSLNYAPVVAKLRNWLPLLLTIAFLMGIVQQVVVLGALTGISGPPWLQIACIWDSFVLGRWVVYKVTCSKRKAWMVVYTLLHLTFTWWFPTLVEVAHASNQTGQL